MKLRRIWLCSAAFLALACLTSPAAADDDSTTQPAPDSGKPPTAASLVERANADEAGGRLEEAASEASAALALDPHNTTALDLRGSIYMEEKLWDRAERDYRALNKSAPDPSYQYKLAQIKFLQKQYDDARPLYAALQHDSRLGDLATFKVFACDFFGRHESIAWHDLQAADTIAKPPSYYYERVVWDVYHSDSTSAQRLAAEAAGRFSSTICNLYLEALNDSRFFLAPSATFTTRDGRKFEQARVSLEQGGLRASFHGGWVTLPLDQLPDDLSPFPPEMREQITRRLHTATAPAPEAAPLTFTTKSGHAYEQVRWQMEESGLDVLTANGWTRIPFNDLPADLSSFPADAKQRISEKRETATPDLNGGTVTFSTKQGRSFDGVRASLNDDGVAALTPDGWVTVPFADLPDDLSQFPPAWRTQIEARLKTSTAQAGKSSVVTFTTQKGTTYKDVRATLGHDGVVLVTPDGWATVPFADLPADLSAFPPDWRPLIQAGIKSASDDALGPALVSFTTRRGKSYDEVRAELADEGLRVLGPDGWVVVSYSQLLDDLSPFPNAWRAVIAMKKKEATKATASTQP